MEAPQRLRITVVVCERVAGNAVFPLFGGFILSVWEVAIDGAIGVLNERFEALWKARPDRPPITPGFGVVPATCPAESRQIQTAVASADVVTGVHTRDHVTSTADQTLMPSGRNRQAVSKLRRS